MTETNFEMGADELETIARKIQKARDSYAKMDVLDPYVEWGERGAFLWHLIRSGTYPASEDPAIWPKLVEASEHASGEDIAEFLANVVAYDASGDDGLDDGLDDSLEDYPSEDYYEDDYYDDGMYDDFGGGGYEEPPFESVRLVSYWPAALDKLLFVRLHEEPEPILDRWDDYTDDVRKGLELIQFRLGERDEAPEGTLTDLAKTYVESGLPWDVWMQRDDALSMVPVGDQNERDELLAFVGQFGTVDEWGAAVLDAFMAAEYMPGFHRSHDIWGIADREQLTGLLGELSLYGADAAKAVEYLVQRDESAAEFAELADELQEAGRNGSAEIAATAALLRRARDGDPIPDGIESHLEFGLMGNPTHRKDYAAREMFAEALHALPLDRLMARINELFDGEYTRLKPFPALHVVSARGEDLLEPALDAAEAHFEQYDNFSSANPVVNGLVLLGIDAIDAIADRMSSTENATMRDACRRAIIGALADSDGFDAEHDRYISFVDWSENPRENDLSHYVFGDVNAAIAHLDDERAGSLFERELQHDGPTWARVLAGLAARPLEAAIDRAFARIADDGFPELEVDYFAPLLREASDEVVPKLGALLASTDSAPLHNAVKRQFGDKRYDEMLAEAGGESAADRGPADKIRRLSKAFFEGRPDATRSTVTVFERLDEPASETSINRIGGRPFGVTSDTWPCKDGDADEPMEHMFTIDLGQAPRLQHATGNARAVALFVASPGHNEAWTPGNSWTEVQLLDEDDVASGPYAGELPAGSEDANAFTVTEVEVPDGAFHVEYGGDQELLNIRNAIYQASAWGGPEPIWLQGEEYFGAFVLQFDEGFAYMNLGDCGVMYVFADTAFWQCH